MTLMVGAASFAAAGLCAAGRDDLRAEEPPRIPGPDPQTRTPKFRLPPGSVDAHAHIFGPAAVYPYSPKRPYTPPDASLADFRALHAKIGVDRAVIVNATVHGYDNRVVTDAIAASGGRYKGVANVSASMSETDLAALRDAGIKGCRFTFLKRLGGVGDMKAFRTIVDRAAALDWHVEIYLEHGTVREFTPLLKVLPATYVIDHMGTVTAAPDDEPELAALLELQAADPKCWVKISGPERASLAGPPFHDAVPIARRIIANAPDRVVWGTDWPHPNVKIMPNDGDLVDLVELYAPDPQQRQKLLVTNPVRLFGFDA